MMISNKDTLSDDQLKLINALSRESAIRILLNLCEDSALVDRIYAMAISFLAKVDADEIANEVFRNLNSIQVEELWDNSGSTRLGYEDPTDVAFEMIENNIRPFVRKLEQLESLGMKYEGKEFCKGIISGLLRYASKGSNEFHDWVPDDPYTVAENIIYDRKKNHSIEDIKEIQAVYDSFFFDGDENDNEGLIVGGEIDEL